MAKKRSSRGQPSLFPEKKAEVPAIPAEEALSFLRETRGVTTWTVRDMADALKIGVADAKRVIPILELQGYVKPAGANEWMTTLSGEDVSGSKPPRFTRERVAQALDDLRGRIADINRDSKSPYKITEAVAFGDFLSDRPRVQSAEAGIRLERRGTGADDAWSGVQQRDFLRQLHARGGVIQVRPYEPWMRERRHRNLL
ncbi:MAG TPA: hypothetical protein VIY66_04330 [Candidatus Acidoferrales bacterium]